MKGSVKVMFLVLATAAALLPGARSEAELILLNLRAPEQCPDGLSIKSKAVSGMIEYDVSLDAEEIAHAGDLYKGRVRSQAFLQIGAPEEQIASVTVQGNSEGRRTRYLFRLSPSAARTSELQIAVSLYERNNQPTLGGGVSLRVLLAGFEPNGDSGKPEKR